MINKHTQKKEMPKTRSRSRKRRNRERTKLFKMDEPGRRHSEMRSPTRGDSRNRYNCALRCEFVDTNQIDCNRKLFQSVFLKCTTCLRDIGERIMNNRFYFNRQYMATHNRSAIWDMARGNSCRKPYIEYHLTNVSPAVGVIVRELVRYPILHQFWTQTVQPSRAIWVRVSRIQSTAVSSDTARRLLPNQKTKMGKQWLQYEPEVHSGDMRNEWVLPLERLASCLELLQDISKECRVSPGELQELNNRAEQHLDSRDYDEYVVDFETLNKDTIFGGIAHLPVRNEELAKAVLDLEHLTYITHTLFRKYLRDYHAALCIDKSCLHHEKFEGEPISRIVH